MRLKRNAGVGLPCVLGVEPAACSLVLLFRCKFGVFKVAMVCQPVMKSRLFVGHVVAAPGGLLQLPVSATDCRSDTGSKPLQLVGKLGQTWKMPRRILDMRPHSVPYTLHWW